MTPQLSEVDSFFSSGGAPAPERVNGRYKFVDPFGNEVTATSASNYGYPLQDQYGLNKWRLRQLVIGIRKRPDLVALLSVLDPEDTGKVDEIVSTALEVAGTTTKANRGTAIHEAFRLADLGQEYPVWAEPFVASYQAEKVRHGLTVGLIERDVYSPGLGARGRLDRTYIEADGTHVLGDVKSTGRLELQAHEISVQLKVYQSATHVRNPDGSWEPIPRGKHPLRDDYAIVVHVDQESSAVTLYRVDLRIGAMGANLAEQVRGWRKSGPVLLPYVPPAQVPARPQSDAALLQTQTVEQIKRVSGVNPDWGPAPIAPSGYPETDAAAGALTEAQANAIAPDPWAGPAVTGPPATAQGGQYPVVTDTPGFGVPEPRVPAPDPFTQGMQAGLAHQPTDAPASWAHPDNLHNDQQPPLKTAAEMMKSNFTKAQVQQYCRDHGITDDLAHTKAKLIEKLNAKGKLAHPGAAQATAAPTVHPAQTEAFRTMVLSKIGNAASAGELQTINRDVVRQGGDQAWTDAMTEAARVRVGQLDAVTPQSDGNVLDKIRAASVPQDLAKLWEEITIGGSVPGNWTPAIDQASHARLAELNAARPPAPVNPFGP